MLRRGAELLGETVGSGWLLQHVVGMGGTSTVFAARAPNGRVAAVKLMHAHVVATWSRRFEREARLLETLHHPAVPALHEFGRFEGLPFLVVDLLVGHSLDRAKLRRAITSRVQKVVDYALEALEALAAVHARGVLHRDLKPSNLFLTTAGRLKVLDFGTATSEEFRSSTSDSLTSGLLGTPAFMPPEQARGRWDLVDERSDLWSLAAVMFSLITRQHVHPARTSNEQLGLAMARAAPSIRSIAPQIDAGTASAIDRALAYRRQDRFSTAREFHAALANPCPPLTLSTRSVTTLKLDARSQSLVSHVQPIAAVTLLSAALMHADCHKIPRPAEALPTGTFVAQAVARESERIASLVATDAENVGERVLHERSLAQSSAQDMAGVTPRRGSRELARSVPKPLAQTNLARPEPAAGQIPPMNPLDLRLPGETEAVAATEERACCAEALNPLDMRQ